MTERWSSKRFFIRKVKFYVFTYYYDAHHGFVSNFLFYFSFDLGLMNFFEYKKTAQPWSAIGGSQYPYQINEDGIAHDRSSDRSDIAFPFSWLWILDKERFPCVKRSGINNNGKSDKMKMKK
jgi:hypothetical protein